jgi:hypothetical protein
VHYINIGVALKRPPFVDEYRRYAIAADTRTEAELIALQMAACTSVMPVRLGVR